ncbi:MAG: hypothetical protein QG635_2164 [Bacteroidota bacterium]|nr:hypothetical protein [Bacteroidota bacterium]
MANLNVAVELFLETLVSDEEEVLLEYEPFGEKIETASSGDADRTSFIGKERDGENCLSDFGVRKYGADVGRFMQAELY